MVFSFLVVEVHEVKTNCVETTRIASGCYLSVNSSFSSTFSLTFHQMAFY